MVGPPSPDRAVRLRGFLRARRRHRELVHDLHRDLRRDRFEDQILGRVLGHDRSGRSPEPRDQLRELERVLGRWRDLEMARDLWRSVRSRPLGRSEARWLAERGRSLDGEAHHLEAEAVRITRTLLPARAASPRRLTPERGMAPVDRQRRWANELESRQRRYRKALDAIGPGLPAEPTHAFRQEVRKLTVLYDLLAATPWADPPGRGPKLRRLLDRLGNVHDLDRAIARLRKEPAGELRDEYRRRLLSARRAAAKRSSRLLAERAVRRYAETNARRER